MVPARRPLGTAGDGCTGWPDVVPTCEWAVAAQGYRPGGGGCAQHWADGGPASLNNWRL